MKLGLENRVVIVTGGSRGIGRAAARAFASEGARVLITYASDRERAQAFVEELRASGPDAVCARLELGAPETIQTAVALAIERWNRIDVLVNNAVQWGTHAAWGSPFEGVEQSTWRPLLEANLGGHYAAIQSVLPAMRARSWGRIVNISSTIAVDGMAGSAAYAAAKSGLHGLTRTLAKELSGLGILSNVVMPGLTLTETNAERLSDEEREQHAKTLSIGRLLTAEEVVPVIVFLASAANTAITGQVIRTSGD